MIQARWNRFAHYGNDGFFHRFVLEVPGNLIMGRISLEEFEAGRGWCRNLVDERQEHTVLFPLIEPVFCGDQIDAVNDWIGENIDGRWTMERLNGAFGYSRSNRYSFEFEDEAMLMRLWLGV